MKTQRKIIAAFVGLVLAISFLGLTPTVFANYKNYTGTYTGKWKTYDMTCPLVYSNNNGIVTIKIKAKATGKYTGRLKFKGNPSNTISGKIKNTKLTLHFPGYARKYDYKGTIKKRAIKLVGYNDDMLNEISGMRCPTGWKQKMSLKKK